MFLVKSLLFLASMKFIKSNFLLYLFSDSIGAVRKRNLTDFEMGVYLEELGSLCKGSGFFGSIRRSASLLYFQAYSVIGTVLLYTFTDETMNI